MSSNNLSQTAEADEQQAVSMQVREPAGAQSNGGGNAEDASKAAKRSRSKRALIISVAAVAVIATTYFVWNAYRYEDTDDAQVDGHVMPLSAKISGQIEGVHVIEGQFVHASDVLVTIDPADYNVAAEQAHANLANALATAASSHWSVPITSTTVQSTLDSAKTAVANAEAGLKGAEHNFESAKAALTQAEANAAKSDADLERAKQLVAREDISRQQYDQAVASATANRALVSSAESAVHASEQSVQQAQGKVLQAKSDLQTAKTAPQQVSLIRANALAADAQASQRRAQFAQAQLNLSYTIIRSPVTGIIGKKSVEVGQNVSIGQEMLEVIPLDDVWITANFKETQLAHMRAGQSVEIKVDAYGRKWKGRVTNIGGGTGAVFSLLPPENATGNYVKVVQRVPVRIDFDRITGQDFNAEGLLKPGLSVLPDVRVR
jgi:membrane fusion protein (multidrug efflux system)